MKEKEKEEESELRIEVNLLELLLLQTWNFSGDYCSKINFWGDGPPQENWGFRLIKKWDDKKYFSFSYCVFVRKDGGA